MKKSLLSILMIAAVLYSVKMVGTDSLLSVWKAIQVQSNDRDFALKSIQGEAAIVMDERTGDILFYKNDKEKLYPASTTKIATALVAIEHGILDELVTVGKEAEPMSGESRAGLQSGETYPLKDLLYAMMLPSGNDAARTIAVHLGRELSGNPGMGIAEATAYFADLMNQRAKQAGAVNTHFVNPHGLHDENHYSTARDLMMIAREAMQHDLFRSMVNSEYYTAAFSSGSGELSRQAEYNNRNKLLDRNSSHYYEAANGIKTGFTDQAGYCLVSSASQYNADLIAVVLKSDSEGVWYDSRQLLEYGFRQLGG